MPALVRFRFTRDLLIPIDGELSPRTYSAPFTYDLKMHVARLAVSGGHGIVEMILNVDDDEADEIMSNILLLSPQPMKKPEGLPPVPAAPTSDAVVIAAAKDLGPAPEPPPPAPTSDAVVIASLSKEV